MSNPGNVGETVPSITKDSDSRCNHDHDNPLCECNTDHTERAFLLTEYLDQLETAGWSELRLMPLGEGGKEPAIAGRFGLDDPRVDELLHEPKEAVSAVRGGADGFALYAGRDDHGTEGLVFTDHDDPSRWSLSDCPSTLTVMSGSGRGYNLTYRNDGSVSNSVASGQLRGAGEVRASNWYVVMPGSIHPTGGIYHTLIDNKVAILRSDDLPEELRPDDCTLSSCRNNGPIRIDPDEIDSLPQGYNPDLTTNDWGVPLKIVRKASRSIDSLLRHLNPANKYPSPSEADMATVSLLLIWGFSEPDIADILRSTRARRKLQRNDYVHRTIARTSLTRVTPLDPRLGSALVATAIDNDGQVIAHEATLSETRMSLEALGGEATVAQLVDRGLIDWRGASRKSVMKRTRRALKIFEAAGFVTRKKMGGVVIWEASGLSTLELPHI